MLEHTHYDVQGNLTDSTRRLAAGHRGTPDWSALAVPDDPAALAAAAEALLEDGGFRKLTWYDAIGRPVQTTTPASADMEPCVLRHGYGEGGLLDRLDVWLHRAAAPAGLLDPDTADLHVLTDLTYDAAGRTTSRVRGNGTTTDYRYDAGTARLLSLTTTRPGFPAQERTVQALAYTHDPVGNVTRVRDTADLANAVFFRNRRVEPGTDYTYDHLYRLIRATGREHVGLADGGTAAPSPTGPDDGPRTGLAHPGDGNAVVTYVESYRYDEASNMLETAHVTASGTWRRGFAYDEPSAIDPADRGNRLSATGPATSAPASWVDRYGYDADGTTTSLPHLPLMTWDLGGRLASTASQVVTTPGAVPETTHYQYDGDGERTRLTIDRAAGRAATPRPAHSGSACPVWRSTASSRPTVRRPWCARHCASTPATRPLPSCRHGPSATTPAPHRWCATSTRPTSARPRSSWPRRCRAELRGVLPVRRDVLRRRSRPVGDPQARPVARQAA